MVEMLLISNSYSYKKEYLDHCIPEIKSISEDITEILFIPYALSNNDAYFQKVKQRLAEVNLNVISIHQQRKKRDAILNSKAIFVGGGNTFLLLKKMYDEKLLDPIRKSVGQGSVYIGTSAGIVIAGPTIKTTNDMPIVFPPSFDALHLLNFHINAHYFDTDPDCKVMMETRFQRIKEFQEQNKSIVLGLREDSLLRINERSMIVKGKLGCKIFPIEGDPYDVNCNSDLSYLL